MKSDFELFPGKDMSGLFKDIYNNQQVKKRRISELIFEIKNKIRNINDWVVIGPIINELISISVRNDDNLVKLATVAQRLANASGALGENDGLAISEDEKKQLLKEVETISNQLIKDTEKELDELTYDVESIKQKIQKNESKGKNITTDK